MARRRNSAGSRRAAIPSPSAQARGRHSPSPSRDATTEHREDDRRDEEIRRLREEQSQSRQDMRQTREIMRVLLETVHGMATTLASLQERAAEETPPGVPAEQMRGTPVVAPAPGVQSGGQGEVPRPRQFECGESSRASGSVVHAGQRWDVDRFQKNGGTLFTGDTDPETALIWFDDTEVVLEHMGCPPGLWVRVIGGAIRGAGRTWWRSVLDRTFRGRRTEEIAWEEFREVFFRQFFSATVVEEKKIEFMALEQGDLTVAEYHARFLALERFAPGSFQTERQRAAKFVRGLRLSLHSIVAMFHCATLEEAVATALEGEAAHRIHHARRAREQSVQSGRQRQRPRGESQQDSPERQRADDTAALYAVQGQLAEPVPEQYEALQFQIGAQQ